jgi:hypothetical protein
LDPKGVEMIAKKFPILLYQVGRDLQFDKEIWQNQQPGAKLIFCARLKTERKTNENLLKDKKSKTADKNNFAASLSPVLETGSTKGEKEKTNKTKIWKEKRDESEDSSQVASQGMYREKENARDRTRCKNLRIFPRCAMKPKKGLPDFTMREEKRENKKRER